MSTVDAGNRRRCCRAFDQLGEKLRPGRQTPDIIQNDLPKRETGPEPAPSRCLLTRAVSQSLLPSRQPKHPPAPSCSLSPTFPPSTDCSVRTMRLLSTAHLTAASPRPTGASPPPRGPDSRGAGAVAGPLPVGSLAAVRDPTARCRPRFADPDRHGNYWKVARAAPLLTMHGPDAVSSGRGARGSRSDN